MQYPEHTPINMWEKNERPREKLIEYGCRNLSNAELLAILLGSGSKKLSAIDLAKLILKSQDDDINKLSKLSAQELCKYPGVGIAKAVTIIAAMELARRKSNKTNDITIQSSNDAFQYIAPVLSDLQYEEFWVIFLHSSNKIISRKKISQGGIAGTIADVRIILKEAILLSAPSIIICHNHPSGNIMASNADINITKKIKSAASTLDINLLDHLIIGINNYYSFADEGKI